MSDRIARRRRIAAELREEADHLVEEAFELRERAARLDASTDLLERQP